MCSSHPSQSVAQAMLSSCWWRVLTILRQNEHVKPHWLEDILYPTVSNQDSLARSYFLIFSAPPCGRNAQNLYPARLLLDLQSIEILKVTVRSCFQTTDVLLSDTLAIGLSQHDPWNLVSRDLWMIFARSLISRCNDKVTNLCWLRNSQCRKKIKNGQTLHFATACQALPQRFLCLRLVNWCMFALKSDYLSKKTLSKYLSFCMYIIHWCLMFLMQSIYMCNVKHCKTYNIPQDLLLMN